VKKQTGFLSERQAWRVIAGIFGRPIGICTAVFQLRHDGVIDRDTAQQMWDTIERERVRQVKAGVGGENSYLWPFPLNGGYDNPRVAFARKRARLSRPH
jgi:hypothetical protein